jgi:hypothetical protein
MGTRLQRFIGRLTAKGTQFLQSGITWGAAIKQVLTLIALMVIAIAPGMKEHDKSWSSVASWKSCLVAFGWAGILGALYLRFADRFAYIRGWTRQQRERRVRRKMIAGPAISEICKKCRANQKTAGEMHKAREGVLEAAALSVESVLKLGNYRIDASLLDFSAASPDKMRVVARSNRSRPIDVEYEITRLAAWTAVSEARAVAVDDISLDPRWDGDRGKQYRTMICVPITSLTFAVRKKMSVMAGTLPR